MIASRQARRRRRGVARALVFAALLLVAGPSAATTLNRGNQVEPETLDPQRAESVSALNILRDLYEGLVGEAPDGSLVPGAAERWEVSDDGRVYTFHLRPDLRWSNGDPLTASDFVVGLRRTVDPATGSKFAQMLSPIRNADEILAGKLPYQRLGATVLDARTVRIELKSPAAYFPGLLTHPTTFPVHRASFKRYGSGFARVGRLISNGAYQLSDWVVQSQVTLQRNPRYWNDRDTAIDTVVYHVTEDVSSELKRYRAGELDWTYDIPLSQLGWIRQNLGSELRTGPYLGSYYFGFNLRHAPFRDQVKLRRALALVVDREAIVGKLLGTGERPAYGLVPPGTWNYQPQQFAWAPWPMARRIAEAQRLYREAGYGEDRPLEVEIRYNTQEDHKRIALAIAWMWKQALGVQATLVNEEWKVFLQNRRFGAATQFYRGGWIGDYNDASTFLQTLQTGNGGNDAGYANPAYDALLAQAGREPDPQRRRALLEQAERLALADVPILPIYFYVTRRMVKPYVRGWQPNIMNHYYSKHMRIER